MSLQVVTKTSDETVNNSDALQADDELVLAVLANETLYFEYRLVWHGDGVPDLKTGFTYPSGTTIRWEALTPGAAPLTETDVKTRSGAGVGVDQMDHMRGIIQVGGTAGNVQLTWAQNVADMSDTVVLAGSMIWAHTP